MREKCSTSIGVPPRVALRLRSFARPRRCATATWASITPCGTHIWGGRTAEQPPTVLWAARHFQPDRFGAVNLVSETQAFYRDLFGSGRSAAQVEEILDGGPR